MSIRPNARAVVAYAVGDKLIEMGPFRWGTVFGDDTMAGAVIDRIVHHGKLLQFHGESYRMKKP